MEKQEINTAKFEEHQITLYNNSDKPQVYKLKKNVTLELGSEYIFKKGMYYVL